MVPVTVWKSVLVGDVTVAMIIVGGSVSTTIVAVSDAVFPTQSMAVAVITLSPSSISVISTDHVAPSKVIAPRFAVKHSTTISSQSSMVPVTV